MYSKPPVCLGLASCRVAVDPAPGRGKYQGFSDSDLPEKLRDEETNPRYTSPLQWPPARFDHHGVIS